jgi:hypothetical protein
MNDPIVVLGSMTKETETGRNQRLYHIGFGDRILTVTKGDFDKLVAMTLPVGPLPEPAHEPSNNGERNVPSHATSNGA